MEIAADSFGRSKTGLANSFVYCKRFRGAKGFGGEGCRAGRIFGSESGADDACVSWNNGLASELKCASVQKYSSLPFRTNDLHIFVVV